MPIAEFFKKRFGLTEHTIQVEKNYSEESFDIPNEMLEELPWLSKLNEAMLQQVFNGFQCRQYQEGLTLFKEEDPDSGMFVLVDGRVKIEIRGIPVDVVGAGSLIGEMSVLTGYPRSASIVAETAVKVLWMESHTLKTLMKKSKVLENGLWEFTSKRFAMNLLGKREPYSQWEQNKFIQWLSMGVIKVPDEKGLINLKRKVGVLVSGTASRDDGNTVIESPASLTGTDFLFSQDARVFLRDK